MTVWSAPRTSRRSFLKLGAAAIAAALVAPSLDWLARSPGVPPQSAQSAAPRPSYAYVAVPESLLSRRLDGVDVALVPAEAAARLIQGGRLQLLDGPAGRAHDPEGRYTIPHAYRVAAVRYPDEAAAPNVTSWAGLWQASERAVWPASGRVLVGAALLRRGFSPNETHPGRLAAAAHDLAQLRPRLAPPETEPSDSWPRRPGALAVVLADPALIGQANGLRLPAEGTLLIEYDWVITAGAARVEMARRWLEPYRASAPLPPFDLPARPIPLMPLPAAARAQHAEIWAALGV